MSFWFFNLLGALMVLGISLSYDYTMYFYCYNFDSHLMYLYVSLISVYFFMLFINNYSGFSMKMVELISFAISALFAITCFVTTKMIIFWVSYELAIIFPLILIFYSSGYSERYNAGWYLLLYVLLTSVPMLFILFFMGTKKGNFYMSGMEGSNNILTLMLCILFMTKVPLFPFHAWLPIVHAEASSFVSMMLSGYVMKLGLMGMYRFCYDVCMKNLLSITFMFLFSLSFLLVSFQELDVKRWLAFLSLSHIMISLLGLVFLDTGLVGLVGLYSFGHGISACVLFYYFNSLSLISGSRNWSVLFKKNSKSNFVSIIFMISLLTVVGFPMGMSFFSEVVLLKNLVVSLFTCLLFFIYLFIGGLVPLVFSGYLLGVKVISNSNNKITFSVLFKTVSFLLVYFIFFISL